MKFLATSMTVVLCYSGIAMAQMQEPVQVQIERQDTPQQPELRLVTGNESRHARDADARHCLAMTTDVQIIRCAEKYRYRRYR